MKLTFEPNLNYQQAAIKAVTKLFEGQPQNDSAVESQFAKDCETSEQIKFYFKLPDWF